MTKTTFFAFFFCASIVLLSCKPPTASQFHLSKIIYHLSRCNGTCPQLDLQVDSSRNFFVNREYFKTKSETDSTFSGQFKGQLTQEDYNKLIALLEASHLDTLTFTESGIMDVAKTTFIVYYNGQRKELKSARPPAEATPLITFLKTIAENKELQKTSEVKEME